MRDASRLPRRRKAFTLVEMLVVMALILAIFAIGVGYVVFGQSNQHSFTAAQAVTGAMLNAKQRARRDGVPTGVRILFTNTKDASGNPALWASQMQIIQQPGDYNAGQLQALAAAGNVVTILGGDLQGGAQYMGQIDESTVQGGDYLWLPGTPFAHQIQMVSGAPGNQTLNLNSPVGPVTQGQPYVIHRGPRRLPSEDVIQLPPSIVIDDSVYPQPAGANSIQLCQNVPQRQLWDYGPTPPAPTTTPLPPPTNQTAVAEIVFAPSGAVIGQGTGADKILLWLRDPTQLSPTAGAPLIVSVQIRTGLISVYQVAPWNPSAPVGPGNDPYAYAKDGRASGS